MKNGSKSFLFHRENKKFPIVTVIYLYGQIQFIDQTITEMTWFFVYDKI